MKIAHDPQLVRLLAPTGTLRAGLYAGTPTSIVRNAAGEARGVGYDMGGAFAQFLGVPLQPVVFEKNADVLAAIKAATVDVIFTNASAERAEDMDFSAPYLDIELGYLVPAGSKVEEMADIDQPGMRIAVTAKSSSDGTLSRELKQATLVRAATLQLGIGLLHARQADAYATNKPSLHEMAGALPGARVLEGHWGLERHALAIPKGRDAALPLVHRFAEEAKAQGLVQAAMERAALRGASVAAAFPPSVK